MLAGVAGFFHFQTFFLIFLILVFLVFFLFFKKLSKSYHYTLWIVRGLEGLFASSLYYIRDYLSIGITLHEFETTPL